MQSADEKIPKQISSHDISKDVKRISSRVLVPRTSLVEQVLTRAQEVAGAPLLATPHSGMLLQEAEALEAISTLLKQVNRRGFW